MGSLWSRGSRWLLLIVSFFTKVRGAIKWAVIVFVLVVVQGQLGFLGHEFPWPVRCTGSTPWRCSAWPSTPVVVAARRRHRPRSRSERQARAATPV